MNAHLLILRGVVLLGTLTTALAQTAAVAPPAGASAPATNAGPKIQFSELSFDFGKVESGTLVKHSFIFTNSGTALLEVTGVRPSCGCTTAGEWDKKVEPGKTGAIPLQFNSTGYGGQVLKTITVTCNDPAQTNVVLQLKGSAWKPVDLAPAYAMFTPGPDAATNETRLIKIVNNQDEPLAISEVQCTNQALKAELKTIKDGKEFELLVTAVAPFQPQHIWAPIILKTSSSKMPTLTVNCYLNPQPAMVAMPSQITLPAGPLTNAPKFSLTLRNNTTNSVTLSEPRINIEGADLTVTEIQPGRVFNVTATFPVGFKSQPNQVLEATLKSSDPRNPLVKIPIFQPTPPAPVAPAAASAAVAPAVGQVSPVKNSSPSNTH